MYKAYYTCNNGVYFEYNNTGIFIDGIFDGLLFGFSATSDKVLNACQTRSGVFKDLSALLFTHTHEDHFCEKEISELTELSRLPVYAPGYTKNTLKPYEHFNKTSCFKVNDFDIISVKTQHDGDARINRVAHESFIINTAEDSIFFAGDAVFSYNDLAEIKNRISNRLTAAFINPYHIIERTNSDFLKELDPLNIYMIHRPLPADDNYNVSALLKQALRDYPDELPSPIIPQYNSWI